MRGCKVQEANAATLYSTDCSVTLIHVTNLLHLKTLAGLLSSAKVFVPFVS